MAQNYQNIGDYQGGFYQIGRMHIGLLNDPNNFHTQKWGKALQDAGAEVTVFSFDADQNGGLPSVQVPTASGSSDYNYISYLKSGPALRAALDTAGVDLVNALNITPFGVWAARSGFRPLIASAMGADILEYPPQGQRSPLLDARSWDNVEGSQQPFVRFKGRLKRQYFRRKVAQTLRRADLITGDNRVLVDAVRDWFRIPEEKVRLLRWGVEPELLVPDETEMQKLRDRFGIRKGASVVLSPRGAKAIYQADLILEAFEKLLERNQRGADQLEADQLKAIQSKTDQLGTDNSENPPPHFIMLSAGYEVSRKIKDKARHLSEKHPNFTFVDGMISRQEVAQLWHLVDVFVSAPIYDGYSASLAEGRYTGAIPVVNSIPGNLELIQHGENGWITSPFTPEQLAQDLLTILKEKTQLKARFRAKNREWIEKHSLIDQNAKLFLQWAEELLHKIR